MCLETHDPADGGPSFQLGGLTARHLEKTAEPSPPLAKRPTSAHERHHDSRQKDSGEVVARHAFAERRTTVGGSGWRDAMGTRRGPQIEMLLHGGS